MKDIFKGIFLTLGIIFCFGLVFAIGFHSANEIIDGNFGGNYTFVGSKLNFTGASINGLNSGEIPSGAIMPFYLTICPTGWKPADGTDSTPDLRGQFLRGLNTFDGGVSNRSDGNQDPDSRNLGDYQDDMFESHTHNFNRRKDSPGGGSAYYVDYLPDSQGTTSATGGDETRPKNIAIIYCIKE